MARISNTTYYIGIFKGDVYEKVLYYSVLKTTRLQLQEYVIKKLRFSFKKFKIDLDSDRSDLGSTSYPLFLSFFPQENLQLLCKTFFLFLLVSEKNFLSDNIFMEPIQICVHERIHGRISKVTFLNSFSSFNKNIQNFLQLINHSQI